MRHQPGLDQLEAVEEADLLVPGAEAPAAHALLGEHLVQGLGARLTGEWQSATRVDGIDGFSQTQLRFGSLATFDLRLFADLGQRPKLVESVPFLRGARVTLGVSNLFDTRQEVRDATGATPLAYNPFFLDPVGRSFQLSLRKLFFTAPTRGALRRR